jgi:hypothetical protein
MPLRMDAISTRTHCCSACCRAGTGANSTGTGAISAGTGANSAGTGANSAGTGAAFEQGSHCLSTMHGAGAGGAGAGSSTAAAVPATVSAAPAAPAPAGGLRPAWAAGDKNAGGLGSSTVRQLLLSLFAAPQTSYVYRFAAVSVVLPSPASASKVMRSRSARCVASGSMTAWTAWRWRGVRLQCGQECLISAPV